MSNISRARAGAWHGVSHVNNHYDNIKYAIAGFIPLARAATPE